VRMQAARGTPPAYQAVSATITPLPLVAAINLLLGLRSWPCRPEQAIYRTPRLLGPLDADWTLGPSSAAPPAAAAPSRARIAGLSQLALADILRPASGESLAYLMALS